MVPHYSGTTLDAQARYAAGTKQILDNYLKNKDQEPGNIIIGIGENTETMSFGVKYPLTFPFILSGKYATKACEYHLFNALDLFADSIYFSDGQR